MPSPCADWLRWEDTRATIGRPQTPPSRCRSSASGGLVTRLEALAPSGPDLGLPVLLGFDRNPTSDPLPSPHDLQTMTCKGRLQPFDSSSCLIHSFLSLKGLLSLQYSKLAGPACPKRMGQRMNLPEPQKSQPMLPTHFPDGERRPGGPGNLVPRITQRFNCRVWISLETRAH